MWKDVHINETLTRVDVVVHCSATVGANEIESGIRAKRTRN